MATQSQTLPAQVLAPGEGEALWWAGQLATLKATAGTTGGTMTVVEIEVAAGYETPLHIHHREHEGFWILEGRATFTVGDQTIEAPVGTYLFGPQDVPHKWAAGPDGVRMLYLFAPSGFEDMIHAMGEPAPERVAPSPVFEPPENIGELAAEFGVELLG